jgi:hypothetical protein
VAGRIWSLPVLVYSVIGLARSRHCVLEFVLPAQVAGTPSMSVPIHAVQPTRASARVADFNR